MLNHIFACVGLYKVVCRSFRIILSKNLATKAFYNSAIILLLCQLVGKWQWFYKLRDFAIGYQSYVTIYHRIRQTYRVRRTKSTETIKLFSEKLKLKKERKGLVWVLTFSIYNGYYFVHATFIFYVCVCLRRYNVPF